MRARADERRTVRGQRLPKLGLWRRERSLLRTDDVRGISSNPLLVLLLAHLRSRQHGSVVRTARPVDVDDVLRCECGSGWEREHKKEL